LDIVQGITTPPSQNPATYNTLHTASDLVGSSGHSIESTGSIKHGKFLE